VNNSSIQSSDNGYSLPGPVMEAMPQNPNTRLRRYLVFLRRYWWLPLLTLLLGLAGAAADIHWGNPEYISSASMWETEKLLLPGGAAFSEDAQTYMGTQLELLRSEGLAQRTRDRLQVAKANVIPRDKNGQPPQVTISVQQVPKSTIFQVSALSSDPAYSQSYLDALLNVYLEYKKTVRKTVSGDTMASISEQVLRWETDLKGAEDALNAYERTNNMAIVQEEGTVAGGYLAKLQTELSDLSLESRLLDEAEQESKAGQTNARAALALPTGGMNASVNESTAADHLSPDQEIELLKMQREKLSKNLRPKHPKIVKIDGEIEREERIIQMVRAFGRDQFAASRLANRDRMTNILAEIQEWQTKVTEANHRLAEVEQLKQNVSRTQAVYDRLNAMVQNVDISRNIDQETLATLAQASPARRSFAQETKAIEMAIFGGLGCGFGLVFLLTLRDDRFHSVAEINEKFGEVVVGQVPELRRIKGKAQPLLALDDGGDMYAESYRNLRSAIFFMPAEGERPKILLITSAVPGEGKSTIAINLGRALCWWTQT
jgi:polysaccharide biosynthesis transport protein